ncbi:interleukin-12 subunit alpha [Synchiropus splendidus]|uniref:interleukin-12 subunit alpha n=1 Tax=Synchiropus splendidus TaxID=270530 RepID=UPI00237E58BC|nr:interleukin-12 subunit alpha [Synchiropus splendidus]
MANFTLHMRRCATLLLLLQLGRSAFGNPVTTRPRDIKMRPELFKELLDNVGGLLKNTSAKGEICYFTEYKNVHLNTQSETVEVCTPDVEQSSSCMMGRKSPFNKDKCWSSIMADMAHYHTLIQSYLNVTYSQEQEESKKHVLYPTLGLIQRLVKLHGGTMRSDSSQEEVAKLWQLDGKDRLRMCDWVRGFHTRLLTVNRAVGYIASGDYKK